MELSEKYMKKPEMIIFDYGKTLLYEPDWNSERGNRELMKYITKNPHNCTLEDIAQEIHTVFSEIEMVRDTLHYDIPSSEKRHYDNNGTEVDFEYLHIHDWLELIEILKERN